MKTIVYVDGYNLYFSRLKHTNYKWLDLYTLFHNIIHPIHPSSELDRIKYYTADIKPKFASHGANALHAQHRYHRALESPLTHPVEIIKGYYAESKATPMRYKTPPDKDDRIEAWKLEEKQTDVNIALDLYRDVIQQQCEQIVLCTNDTDIVPAIKYIKNDFPNIKIGMVFPRKPINEDRPLPKTLSDLADWKRTYINDNELAISQFRDRVPTNKKPIDKPTHWYPATEE